VGDLEITRIIKVSLRNANISRHFYIFCQMMLYRL
jgi:hypothetical protein